MVEKLEKQYEKLLEQEGYRKLDPKNLVPMPQEIGDGAKKQWEDVIKAHELEMRKIEEQKANDLNAKLATLRDNFAQERKTADGAAEEAKKANETFEKTPDDVEMVSQSSASQPSGPGPDKKEEQLDPLEEAEKAALGSGYAGARREASEGAAGISFTDRAKAARKDKSTISIASPETAEETTA